MPGAATVHSRLNISAYSGKTEIEAVCDGRYTARLVRNSVELESALRLRYEVFKRELSKSSEPGSVGIDIDKYDLNCEHLIVFETVTGKTVGTYRLNTIETARDLQGFYAATEFSIEDLPAGFLDNAVELGRACISKDHRNSRVLFLLWKGLARYLTSTKKRFLFGCCSIFTEDGDVAGNVLAQLKTSGHVHDTITVKPREDKVCIPEGFLADDSKTFELPALVNIYLRIGAKVCGQPAIDREFKTIDYFVIFDLNTISRKYLKMFFG